MFFFFFWSVHTVFSTGWQYHAWGHRQHKNPMLHLSLIQTIFWEHCIRFCIVLFNICIWRHLQFNMLEKAIHNLILSVSQTAVAPLVPATWNELVAVLGFCFLLLLLIFLPNWIAKCLAWLCPHPHLPICVVILAHYRILSLCGLLPSLSLTALIVPKLLHL